MTVPRGVESAASSRSSTDFTEVSRVWRRTAMPTPISAPSSRPSRTFRRVRGEIGEPGHLGGFDHRGLHRILAVGAGGGARVGRGAVVGGRSRTLQPCDLGGERGGRGIGDLRGAGRRGVGGRDVEQHGVRRGLGGDLGRELACRSCPGRVPGSPGRARRGSRSRRRRTSRAAARTARRSRRRSPGRRTSPTRTIATGPGRSESTASDRTSAISAPATVAITIRRPRPSQDRRCSRAESRGSPSVATPANVPDAHRGAGQMRRRSADLDPIRNREHVVVGVAPAAASRPG